MTEDEELLAAWLAGPGARPTEAEARRWLAATRANRVQVKAPPVPEDDGE